MFVNDRYDFSVNTRVLFGVNRIDNLGDVIKAQGGARVFIVTDHGLMRSGIIDRITRILQQSMVEYRVFSEVSPDPSLDVIYAGLEAYSREKFDFIIGVGGGSSIDTAKGIALLETNGGSIYEFEGAERIQKTNVPIIAIPTTAGTGSEVTGSCVVTDTKNHYKVSVRSTYLMPQAAILDPSLITSLPRFIASTTGMDALTHAIEAFVSRRSFSLTDGLALQAIRDIARYLPAFSARRDDLESASHMLLASSAAGIAFSWARVGTVHAISHALGGHCKVPHGLANAMVLPIVMEYSLIGNLPKYAKVAEALGEEVSQLSLREAAEKSVSAVNRLNRDLGIPRTLREWGIHLTPELTKMIALDAEKSGLISCNPKDSSLDELIQLIEKVA